MPIPLSKDFGHVRGWRNGLEQNGGVYEVEDAGYANSRIGNCWMAGRLKKGDLLLCLEHAGDCFHNFMLIEKTNNAWRGIPGSKFGAYSGLAKPLGTVDDATYDALRTGEWINFRHTVTVDTTPPFLKKTI